MIARRPLAAWTAGKRKHGRAYCELDQWSFDPRYTEGRCPICGWAPPGAPSAPRWLVLARSLEWELLGLIMLMVVLVGLGVVAADAAGYRFPGFNNSHVAAGVPQIASPARTQTPSPSAKHTPTPGSKTNSSPVKSSPSPKH